MRCAAFVFVCLAVATLDSRPAAQGTQARPPAARVTIDVLVTSMDGKPLPEVSVRASGPVDREGSTDPSGTVTFTNVTAGAYRLRFEHDQFVTLERDVAVVGKPLKTSVALNAAPPPPPPPKVEAPPQAPATAAPTGSYPPMSVDITDFFEKNFIGNAPIKRSPLGCTNSSTSTLVQLRDPLADHAHADADELIYVVAGEGTHKVAGQERQLAGGVFAIVPRGNSHSIVRRGRQPLVMISTLSGPPCQPEQ
jgi:mannose-6-phosphate isomerase-like protein (cupin superfamily)